MAILVVCCLAILLSVYGDLCAETSRREVEISMLRTQIADLNERLYAVEQMPDMSVPANRYLYLS